MKLSELIAHRNHLLEYNVADIAYHARHKLSEVVHTVKNSVIQPRAFTQTMEEDLDNVVDVFDQFNGTLSGLIQELDLMIEAAEQMYYKDSADRYREESLRYQTLDDKTNIAVDNQILERNLEMTAEVQKMLSDRVSSYVDWKHAGLFIRPGKSTFVNEMVSLDPLYLVDWSNTLLTPSLNNFSNEYRSRVRICTEHPASTDVLSLIPANQIGVCLAFNFFEYVSIDVLEKYLEQIFKKLKPGGTLAMTFNDCDRAHCVALAEKNYCFYTPGKKVKAIAKQIGYQQHFGWNDKLNLTWLELRKPGELDSLKGGQTLAKIIPKTLAKSK